MRALNQKEKQLIRSLIRSGKTVFRLTDFLRPFWPTGKFEISTFQQSVSLQVTRAELDEVMAHIMEVLNLVKRLEDHGYISVWSELPLEDNTETIGQASYGAQPTFIPDITIAADLLKYGNYKITLNRSVGEWSRRGFAYPQNPALRTNTWLILSAVILLAAIGSIDIYLNYQLLRKEIRHDHQQIQSNNDEVLQNQQLNQTIIDSLYLQSKTLVDITSQISENTGNTRAVEFMLMRQNRDLRDLKEQNKDNMQLLGRTDSLLNQLLTKE